MTTERLHAPRIMLAATASGSGKTLLTCALLRLLQRRGKKVCAFKCGPDYIDPMLHRGIPGVASKNLDTWFAGRTRVRALFAEAAKACDISVIEGVMGYYDGVGGTTDEASSFDLAGCTETPAILVIDAGRTSLSTAALVHGFTTFRRRSMVRGVVLNRTSARAYTMLRDSIESETGVEVLGFVPDTGDPPWGSRHLGLFTPEELPAFQEQIERAADLLEEGVDVTALLRLAEEAPDLEVVRERIAPVEGRRVTIGVARDAAFSFYYDDNLRLLEKLGASLTFFSPIADRALPKADGLLFGGGYPENHAEALSENREMLHAVKAAAAQGMPMLAEGGGFLYLQERLIDAEGRAFAMAGALPGTATWEGRPVRFGYAELTEKETGERLRAHEFHYFDSTDNGDRYRAVKPGPRRGAAWDCVVRKGNVTAGFPQPYYYSNPEPVRRFLRRCQGG